MENHEYGSIVDSRSAPYLKSFARGGTLFTHFHALHHPSLPNYLEMTSGSANGCNSDGCAKARFKTNSVFSQLSHNGIKWASWAESMGSRCRMSSAGSYASWHNPGAVLPEHRAEDLPVARRALPEASCRSACRGSCSRVPNLCHDMHNCSIATGNKWLKQHVPPLLHHGAIVVITFDEGSSDLGGGGHIFTAMRGPGVPHRRNARTYSHRSLLAGIERHFGLQRLNGARKARPLPIP